MRNIFFYPAELPAADLERIVRGRFTQTAADPLATIDFPNEPGGSATYSFAVAYDPGMDTIEVTDATFAFQAASRPTEISGFTSANADSGVKLTLGKPARLASVVLISPALGATTQLVVRPADGSAPSPPLYAYPAITLGAGMYSSTSRALGVTRLGDGSGYTVTFATPPLGTSWLFQLVTADPDPTKLTPVAPASPLRIQAVTIDAAPTDLKVTLSAGADVPVWNHPGPLYPESGIQTIGFAPIARKQLQDVLKTSTGPALPLTLTFTSTSAGKLTVLRDKSALTAVYVAKPLATDPATVRLGGSWVPLNLSAPALRPTGTRGVVRVKPRGQEVNAMTPVADADFDGAGVVVDTGRWIAVSSRIAPRAGAPAGSTIALAAVRLPLTSEQAGEVVVEIRADVAGLPGPVAGTAVVQLVAASSATTSFALKSPVTAVTGGAPLWVLARCTKGSVRWHAARPRRANGAEARVSDDGAKTWRKLDPSGIGGAAIPFAQLVQSAPGGGATSVRVRVRGAASAGGAALVANATTTEFPSEVLDALAAAAPAPGAGGRRTTTIELSSSAVADVTFSGLAFEYTP